MKQHFKPCRTCPFRKDAEPDESPGYSPLPVYVAQTLLPYRIPCHERINYDDPDWKQQCDDLPQCVGHAMLRHAEGLHFRMPPQLLDVEPTEVAFESLLHFWAHHRQISLADAAEELSESTKLQMCANELMRGGARILSQEGVPPEC
jgi:hypothetical protein